MKRSTILLAKTYIFSSLFFFTANSFAQSELKEAIIELGNKEKAIFCKENASGKLIGKEDNQRFKSYKTILRAKRKKAKAGNIKAKKQVKNIRKIRKLGDAACKELEGEETPKVQPNPSSSPTPTPAPSEDKYFESNGDITDLGVEVFEIPSGIKANAFRGQIVWEANCTGCHEKRARPTYTLLRQAIIQSPMFYTEELLSVEDASDLTGFLNLFRTPQTD